ncbi:diaminopimelate epimerase [Nocardioides alcanivorans]|uniref:diaminopimelate epimerase n=1 Tax=Nocardioides alcanivorans TaxID=2897352 RepID=UPI0028A015AE|nr:diaminopimelate epimerase [Nocardioides alcanivorans]
MSYSFLLGHGTENDFVLLPDHDGTVHGALSPSRVAALCDRRAGIGGDGVMRVIRARAARELGLLEVVGEAEWFMDYRNSDGSVSEMCGNGVRVFGRHLADAGLVDPTAPVPVATRGGTKVLTFEDDGSITVDMGTPIVLGDSVVTVGHLGWSARHIDMGNPHAVAFVDSLDDAGTLLEPPGHDPVVYPHGVNVEFVVDRGERHVALRVHERGSGRPVPAAPVPAR